HTQFRGDQSTSYYAIDGSNSRTQLGFRQGRIGNPDARWEKNISGNIGIDATLFNNRLELMVEYYKKDIKDLLYTVSLPRSYPMDGVVLLGNCDKTVPGLLMGACSANLPTLQLNAGPKRVGVFKGQRLGSGTDLWKYWDELRTGKITEQEWNEIGKALSCGFGACNTMGTASTMNGLLEALGIMPLGLSTLPVDDERRYTLSREAGRR